MDREEPGRDSKLKDGGVDRSLVTRGSLKIGYLLCERECLSGVRICWENFFLTGVNG